MSDAVQKLREVLKQRDFEITGEPKYWEDTEEKVAADNRLIDFIDANYIIRPTHPGDVTEKNFGNPVNGDINKAIDDIMEDLMVGHNLEYAGKAFKGLFTAHLQAAVREARIEERRTFRKLWDKLGMIFGASAGSATGVTVQNDFGEEWDFQLDREAVNAIFKYMNDKQLTQSTPKAEEK